MEEDEPTPARLFAAYCWRLLRRIALWGAALLLAAALLYRFANPPATPYILAESLRLGGVERQWTPLEDIAPVMARSAVAAEDARFCLHGGIDVAAARKAWKAGARRGASTISQQTVKNVYLWHGRGWFRKGLEALAAPVVDLLWGKRRVLEVYLNVAEFDEGVFGVEAAARRYFGTSAAGLDARQAALLASVLPNPKARDAARPTQAMRRRAADIADGAEAIVGLGWAACFED